MRTVEQVNLKNCIETVHKEARSANGNFYIYDVVYRPQRKYPFKIEEYGLCICLEGEAKGSIDLMSRHLRPSMVAINVPGQLLEQHFMSSDFRGVGIIMNREFVKELGLPYSFQLDRMLRELPLIELQQSQLEALLKYCSMVRKLLEREHPYQMEALHHLTCAFIYGICPYLYQISANRHSTHEEILLQRFLAEVKEHSHYQRKVLFYAERLNISLGHLFFVVKHVSGKSPGEWIDDYVTGEARALLKGTNLTIQQISQQLGFPTQSFFGKFFKRVTGLSPTEYRTCKKYIND